MKKAIKKNKASKILRLKKKPVLKAKKIAPASPAGGPAAKRPAKADELKRAKAKPAEVSVQELRVEGSKYYTGVMEQPVYQKATMAELEHKELPWSYREDVLVLQVRDPWWGHVYWDIAEGTIDRLKKELSSDFDRSKWVLRAYDVSYIHFNGNNAHRFFDIGIDLAAKNWYLNFGSPGTSWCVDIGLILPDGRFITVVRSNTISLPLDGPSWITDEEWMIPDDEFRRLYGMSVGLGPNVTSPVGKLWRERLKKEVSSMGLASMAVSSPVKKPKEKGAFWLIVDTELIVYGATEPDARVTVQGTPVKLRKDGSFTLRFALPDGRQEIPVVARSAKINETRTITPIVSRKTTRNP